MSWEWVSVTILEPMSVTRVRLLVLEPSVCPTFILKYLKIGKSTNENIVWKGWNVFSSIFALHGLQEQLSQKNENCHLLLMPTLFQNCMTFFPPYNTRGNLVECPRVLKCSIFLDHFLCFFIFQNVHKKIVCKNPCWGVLCSDFIFLWDNVGNDGENENPLLVLMLFQTCMTLFPPYNVRRNLEERLDCFNFPSRNFKFCFVYYTKPSYEFVRLGILRKLCRPP